MMSKQIIEIYKLQEGVFAGHERFYVRSCEELVLFLWVSHRLLYLLKFYKYLGNSQAGILFSGLICSSQVHSPTVQFQQL